MDHISSLLPKVLKKRGLDGHAKASLVLNRCTEWLAENLPDYAQELCPTKLVDGVLFIECEHSIASQECKQQSEALLSFLADACPDVSVEQIRLLREETKKAPACR